MSSITVKAPAKVNLFLKVLRKRPDGYHDIETIFEKVALFDTIRIKKSKGGIRVRSDSAGLPTGKENLAYQAASALQDACGVPIDAEIEIEKGIPIGAGLGGGSSDAAAVLAGINKLFALGISGEETAVLARGIGADVPFFLSGSAWGVGRQRGDEIEAIDTEMELWHIFTIPPFSIRSSQAYEWSDKAERREEGPGVKEVLRAIRENDIRSLGKRLWNDLEGLSYERSGFFKELKEALLEDGSSGALISGSGPVLFGIFSGKREVMRSKAKIEGLIASTKEKWQILTASTLNK